MRMLDAIRRMSTRLTNAIAVRRRLTRFRCGDCERSERCGLLPGDDCIARAEQIERDGDQSRARPRGYLASG